jgi:hybrid cluster-associated redox disulfide protein
MTIGEILRMDSGLAGILMNNGMHCLGCPSSQMESIQEACMVHGIDVNNMLEQLNSYMNNK